MTGRGYGLDFDLHDGFLIVGLGGRRRRLPAGEKDATLGGRAVVAAAEGGDGLEEGVGRVVVECDFAVEVWRNGLRAYCRHG